jgi:hypothetical protein
MMNGLKEALAAMLEPIVGRLDALERQPQPSAYVPQAPPPVPVVQVARPETLTAFQRELQAQTKPTPKDIPRELPYNYPLRLYCRPDGEIVQLQGDPQNRAMYQDLGFKLLDADQARRWEEGERDLVLAEQRRKASAISAYRRLEVRVHGFVIDEDLNKSFSHKSTDEIIESYRDECAEQGIKPQIRPPRVTAEPSQDPLLRGVESSESMTIEGLEQKKQRGNGNGRPSGRRGDGNVEVTPNNSQQFRG